MVPLRGYEKGGGNKCQSLPEEEEKEEENTTAWHLVHNSGFYYGSRIYAVGQYHDRERAESGDQSEQVFCIACISREKEIKEKERRTKVEEKQCLEMGVDIDG